MVSFDEIFESWTKQIGVEGVKKVVPQIHISLLPLRALAFDVNFLIATQQFLRKDIYVLQFKWNKLCPLMEEHGTVLAFPCKKGQPVTPK